MHMRCTLAITAAAMLLASPAAGAATPTFERTDYPAGDHPSFVVDADFDGDGAADLATSRVVEKRVSVLLNQGDGTFGPRQDYPIERHRPHEMAVGDFDDDGSPDLAVAKIRKVTGSEDEFSLVSVFLNQGDGTFGEEREYRVEVSPQGVGVSDIDGDEDLDLVTANSRDAVSALYNEGDGTFGGRRDFPLEPDSTPYSLAVGDFSGDGSPDLAVGTAGEEFEPAAVSILSNDGMGGFGPPQEHPIDEDDPDVVEAVAAGDFDEDGDLDLAAEDDDVVVLMNQGAGQFGGPQRYPLGGGGFPSTIAVGDLDGDGSPDLAADKLSRDIALLLNEGDGTFGAERAYRVGRSPFALTLARFDGGGRLDLASANFGRFFEPNVDGSVSVLLNQGPATPRCGGARATIVGGTGDDTLHGTDRADVIAGLEGDDDLKGLEGGDVVCGGSGDDDLEGGQGDDELRGGDGIDRCDGGRGSDTLRDCER